MWFEQLAGLYLTKGNMRSDSARLLDQSSVDGRPVVWMGFNWCKSEQELFADIYRDKRMDR